MAFKIINRKTISSNPHNIAGPVLIIGAAHTGKSEFAQNLLDHSRIATIIGTADAKEPSFRPRLNHLKSLRSTHWDTVDDPDNLIELITAYEDRQVLIDSLNQWIARQITDQSQKYSLEHLESYIDQEATELIQVIEKHPNPNQLFIVTSEVGAGVTPPPALARLFRQSAGRVNTRVAAACKTVILISAGIPIIIKGKPFSSFPALSSMGR